MKRQSSNLLFNPRWTFRAQLMMIAVIPLALSVVVSALVYQAVRGMADVEVQLETTSQALVVNHALLSSALETQTGLRGFAITGDESFLAPYHRALEEFHSHLVTARATWQDDAGGQADFDRAEELFRTYREEVALPVMEHHRRMSSSPVDMSVADIERVHALFADGTGKALIDEIKTLIRGHIARKQVLLDDQIASSTGKRQIAMTAGLAGPLVAVFIALALIGGLLSRTGRGLDQLSLAAEQIESNDMAIHLDISDNRELARTAAGFNRMAEHLVARDRQTLSLDRLSRSLQSCKDIDEAWSVAGRYMPRILPALSGAICVYRASRDLVEPVSTWGLEAPLDHERSIFDPQSCWALRSGYEHHYRPAAGDPSCQHVIADDDGREVLCVPLNSGNEVLGVLVLRALDNDAIRHADRNTAQVVAETLALSIANLRLREALRNQSIKDPLTGLYNRRYLDENLARELARSQRTGQPVSVIVFDADHFKRFNDTWGHDAGDAVLVDLARALKSVGREMDIPCRLGGEEFLLLLPRTTEVNAVGVAERLRELVEGLKIYHEGGLLEQVTISLGVATSSDQIKDGAQLIREADQALYRAKRSGRNRVEAS